MVMARQPTLVQLNDELLVVAPTTRTMRNIPSEVAVDEDDGLPSACAISLDNTSRPSPG